MMSPDQIGPKALERLRSLAESIVGDPKLFHELSRELAAGVQTLLSTISTLQAQVRAWQEKSDRHEAERDSFLAQVREAAVREAVLVKVLKPFAQIRGRIDGRYLACLVSEADVCAAQNVCADISAASQAILKELEQLRAENARLRAVHGRDEQPTDPNGYDP